MTFFISMGGVKIGNIFGTQFKSKAEFIGGLVLVIIGIKILIEHIFLNNMWINYCTPSAVRGGGRLSDGGKKTAYNRTKCDNLCCRVP
jgi:hypothetical protein